MSPSSRESDLAQLREALLQLNSEYFLTVAERRKVCVKIQEFKGGAGRFSHFDPEREKDVFILFSQQLKSISIKELLAFSLVMEDQAMAMAPGSYPNWSNGIHLETRTNDLYEMINPLILKLCRPELFARLKLSGEFGFLQHF